MSEPLAATAWHAPLKASTTQVRMEMSLLTIVSDLEDVGDTVSREMVTLAHKKVKWHRLFSDAGWKDLRDFQSHVKENFDLTLSMLAQPENKSDFTFA